MNVIFKFLKQLYITKYGVTNFEQKWKSIVQYKRNEATNLYFVCCDVANAFGSIIQGAIVFNFKYLIPTSK